MTRMPQSEILIVGAGLSGAVLAREIAEHSPHRVRVIESRAHLAGNCHTERDEETGVMVHRYGPHIFNTNHEDVWCYIQRFGDWIPFVNRVKASTERGVFSMPINLHTINQFFGKRLTPDGAREFVGSLGDPSIGEPGNFEEQALKMLGRELYETFFYGYTKKQWGCEPRELPASILKRLPIRFNYNDNYYNTRYQAIPKDGYTAVIGAMLDHPSINVELETEFHHDMTDRCSHCFYSGSIDGFFDYRHGRLGYRTVEFEAFRGKADILGNAVINHPEPDVAFTRMHEHKHFAPWETHENSIAFREYSKETQPGDIPFYPKSLAADRALLDRYVELANASEHISFIGRLATYRYLDMDQIIGEALDLSKIFLRNQAKQCAIPAFGPQRGKLAS